MTRLLNTLLNTLLTGAAIFIAAATASAQQPMPWGTGVTYLYDGSGNIRKIGNDPQVYDAFGRLVQSDVKGLRSNFSYDQYGNRTGCTTGGGDCQYGLAPSASTNRLGGVTYDASGNATVFMNHTYTYDAVNMITRDGGMPIRDFVYTADDERLAEYTLYNGTWRWTVRDTSGKVLRELTSEGTTGTLSWQWSKDYVYRDGSLMASRQRHPGTGTVTTYHYHLDHLGTPRRITDDADQIVGVHDYHAFGPETSGGTHESPLTLAKFTGHERDVVTGETSATLDYMHARYYSPALGRFLSVDPTWASADLQIPQSWNRYAYALNNPVRYSDPDGRCVSALPCPAWLSSGAAQVGTRAGASVAGPTGVALASAGLTGWQIGRGIGTSTVAGRSVDDWIVTGLVSLMSSASDGVWIGGHAGGKLDERGWTEEDVYNTIDNPAQTRPSQDARRRKGGGTENDPATIYINADGSYVVVNNVTGEVIQASDRTRPWVPEWEKKQPREKTDSKEPKDPKDPGDPKDPNS